MFKKMNLKLHEYFRIMLPLEEAKFAYKKLLFSYDVLCKEFEKPSPSPYVLDNEYLNILIFATQIRIAFMKEQHNENKYNLRRIESIVQESNYKETQVKKMNEIFKKMN